MSRIWENTMKSTNNTTSKNKEGVGSGGT